MTEPTDNEIELLIINYLTGSITQDELANLRNWIEKSPQNKQQFNTLRNAWLLAGYKPENIRKEPDGFDGLLRHLKHEQGNSRSSFHEKSNRFKFLRIAASWLIFLALGSFLTFWFTGRDKTVEIAGNSGKVEVHSPLGSRSRIMMPDSTFIWLNAGTTIKYDRDYGTDKRAVELDGEAYFEVKSDSRHPFIVHTSEIDIRALGTRFNVKAYSEEKSITATLEEGKIDINVPGSGKGNENILLEPNENFVYHKKSAGSEESAEVNTDDTINPVMNDAAPKEINVISNVKTELYTSWKDQRWIIEREPFNTLVPKLERRYNMKIIFQNPDIRNFKFTGTVENESIDQLMNAIKFTAPIDYSIIKDTVRLYLDTEASEKFRKTMSVKN